MDLIQTFDHPSRTMDNQEMYSFLQGVLQIYLEFWNSTEPPFEYIPDLTYQTIIGPIEQQKAAITQITSLLKHIKLYQFFPHVNNLHSMEQLEKLNTDLVSLLQDYFNQTIWKADLESQNWIHLPFKIYAIISIINKISLILCISPENKYFYFKLSNSHSFFLK